MAEKNTSGMITYGGFYVMGDDGSYEKLMDVTDLKEAKIDADDSLKENEFAIDSPDGFSATFTMGRRFRKFILNSVLFGWKAKGPVRKIMLEKAYKITMPKPKYISINGKVKVGALVWD